jgi:hypothetical protein
MEREPNEDRHIVRKLTLNEEVGMLEAIGNSPAERLNMVWPITQDCWAFVPNADVKQEFQRHVASIQRGKR